MLQRSKRLFSTAQLGALFVFILPFVLYIRTLPQTEAVEKGQFILALLCGGGLLVLAVIVSITRLVRNKELGFYWFLSSSLSIMGVELSFVALLITGSLMDTTIIDNPLTVVLFITSVLVIVFLVFMSSHIVDSIEEYYDVPKKSIAWRSLFQIIFTTGIIILSYYALT